MHEIGLPRTLSQSSLEALSDALASAPQDRGVWVLVGREDGVFCSGMDLEATTSQPESAIHASVAMYARCLDALRRAPRPTIACVDGETTGGGVGLAAVCDVVLATPRATFALPEVLFGLIPSLVLPVLVERIPAQRARQAALSAQAIGADEAARIGLVDHVVPAGAVRAELAGRVRSLSRADSRRVEALRRWMLDLRLLEWPAQLAHGAAITATLAGDPRTQTRIRRFFEDGTPPWTDVHEKEDA